MKISTISYEQQNALHNTHNSPLSAIVKPFCPMKKIFYNCFMLCLLVCGSVTLQAATITVTNGNDAGAGSLRQAITDAVAGDVIDFAMGVTTVTLTSAQLNITKNLTINGGTGVTITRDAGAIELRIFRISSGVTVVFNKLTITNGINTSQAGGVNNLGNLTLNDCIVANNTAPQGGGLQNDGTMTMNRCVVHSNRATASRGGGLMIFGSSTTLNNCVFANNQAFFDGSAISKEGTGSLMVTNCTIAKNSTSKGRGGLFLVSGSTTLKNTIVAENTAVSNPNIFGSAGTSSAYNLIGTEGGNGELTNGTNNNLVGVSPMFANSSDPDGADNIFGTADDGLMLTACNFATNVGNNADAPSGTDIAGNTRIFNTTVDIGAYEFQANSSPHPTITLGTIPAILAGATSFTIPYTATSSPTTYSISGTGFSTVTDAALPSGSPITVNLSAPASVSFDFTLTVKNATGCISMATTGYVVVNTPITQACATATFTGIAPIAPTATTAGVGGRGGIHTYTVPAGVTAIRIDARGAKGGSTTFNGGSFSGGKGGRVQGTFAVTPGDVLHILVAGKGGDGNSIAGGENPGQQRTAAGGGGATIVSNGPIGSGTLLLVGAGGGGAGRLGMGGTVFHSGGSGAGGISNIGAGGASVTANGANSITGDLVERDCGEGGKAATNGGNGGTAGCANRLGTNGGGYGGGGAGNYSTPNGNAGGGGGGGYTGGNGGGVAGGNGGTNYVNPSATNGLAGETDLDAAVVINIAASISYTGSPFCKSLTTTGAPTTTGYTGGTFSATPTGLTIDATTGVINPSTSTAGTYTVSYNTLNGCTPATTSVTIQATTTPSVSISPTAVCPGINTTLTATATNGGSSPQFTWTKNNVPVGTGTTLAITNAEAGYVYKVKLVPSAEVCPSPAMAMASVTISDTEKPKVVAGKLQTCYLSVEAAKAAAIAATTATDNCTSAPTKTAEISETCPFIITVTATDGSSNTAFVTYTGIDIAAKGGSIVAASNNTSKTISLCPSDVQNIKLKNYSGQVVVWQTTNQRSPIWVDLPFTANQTQLTVNGQSINLTTYYRAVIRSSCGTCTGSSAFVNSGVMTVKKSNVCTTNDPDGNNSGLNLETTIVKAYPNPVKDRMTLEIDSATEGVAQFEFYDITGKMVKIENRNMVNGYNEVSLNITELASGLYLLQVKDRENQKKTIKVMKQ